MACIMEFTMDIQHIKGEESTAADALSRLLSPLTIPTVSPEVTAEAQQMDAELQRVASSTALELVTYRLPPITHRLCAILRQSARNLLFLKFCRKQSSRHTGNPQFDYCLLCTAKNEQGYLYQVLDLPTMSTGQSNLTHHNVIGDVS